MKIKKWLTGRTFRFKLWSREVGGKRRQKSKRWNDINNWIRGGGITTPKD